MKHESKAVAEKMIAALARRAQELKKKPALTSAEISELKHLREGARALLKNR